MVKFYKFFLLIALMMVFQTSFAQFGASCGIPAWISTKDYPQGSYVFHNGTVYKSAYWSGQTAPINPSASGQTTWTSLGNCDENLLRSNPDLAYTNCGKASDWDNTKTNYNTGELVRYQNGVYQCNWWTAGSETPTTSQGYKFLGICVPPIDVIPAYVNGQVVIQPSLANLNLSATLNPHGFTISSVKIEIKKSADASYTSYNMTASANNASYSWTPPAYGDYNIRYVATNSVGVSSTLNTTIKIALTTPPSVSITNPANNAKYYQLSFAPIDINFLAKASSGNTISKITFKDNTAGTNNAVTVNAQGNYTYKWTPTKYGNNTIEIVAEDNAGTTQNTSISLTIIDPSLENISLSALPNQLKSVMGVTKKFTFDQPISSLLLRDPGLFTYTISGKELTIVPKRPGRAGLAIKTVDAQGKATTLYVGLRVDNPDGTVPKYPEWVSVGSVSEDIDDDVNFYNEGFDNTNLLKNNRMDVRYIYINGGPTGGWSSWQPDRAIKFARNSLKMGLIPFFVFYNIPDGGESYTTDLAHAQDPTYMAAYFDNMTLFLDQVKAQVDDEFFGVVLEPDFLGYMQQNNEPITTPSAVGANSIGKNAGTLQTLVMRINGALESRRIKDNLNMEFGWQLNLWAKPNVAGDRGIIRETDKGDFQTQLAKIKQTAKDIFTYSNNMGIMSHNADFVSIDKYGLDAMGSANGSTPTDPSTYTWFWNNDHWMNYLDFVKSLNEIAGKPVILWQVPVGHINGSQTKNEYTNAPFVTLNNTSKRYEDSASSFFFGDEIDFSNDNVRYNYFTQNNHNDPKLVADPATKKVKWGNHFKETKASGTNLILMGAGVGDSTDGIGKDGITLTDDRFWIQKLQDYYLNNLVSANVKISGLTVTGTNAPIGNAAVLLVDDKGKTVATTTSDAQGNYTFTNITSGYPYALKANKTNYVFADVNLGNVTADLANKNIVGTAKATANISGTTVDGTGSLIPTVNVSLVDNGGTVVGTIVSDVNGKYTFNNIATGSTYTLKGSKASYTFADVNLGNVSADLTDKNLVGTKVSTVNISGLSVSNSGTPIASVNITLSDNTGKTIGTTTSNASGNYVFNNIAAGANYTLKGSRTGYTFVDNSLGVVNSDASGKNIVGTPILINISGTTKSNTGTVIDGVSVTLVDNTGKTVGTTTSDAQGKYTFSTPLGDTYTLKGNKTGYTFVDNNLGVVNSDATGKDLVGTPVAAGTVLISGSTVNNSGAAINGTAVTLVDNTGKVTGSTTSDASGNYSFSNINAGGNYTLRGNKTGYTFADVALGVVNSNVTGKNLVGTTNVVKITGTTKSNTGTAIDGVVVNLIDNTGKTIGATASDALGNYTISNVAAGGSYSLKASKTGYTFNDVVLGTVNSDLAGKDLVGTVNSSSNISISGSTVSNWGVAIGGAVVSLVNNAGVVIGTTASDASANYSFTNISPGVSYTLKASKTGYNFADVDLGVVNADATNKNIVGTVNTISISGAVKTNTGDIIDGAVINLLDNTGKSVATTASDPAGNYNFPNIAKSGDYTLKTDKEGYSFANVALGMVNTSVSNKNIIGTIATINISGTTKTGSGTIISGIVIYLVDNTGKTLKTTASDPSGNYSFPNIPSGGNYTLKANRTSNYTFTDVSLGNITNDTNKDIIGVPVTIKISGTTKTNAGAILDMVVVNLVDNTGKTVATTASDPAGNYYFNNINPGTSYTLKANKSGYTFADVSLGVVNNDVAGKDIVGAISTVKISGITKTNTGTALDMVVVTLVDNTGKTVGTTASDPAGNYSFADITAGGNYTLKANKSGYTFADLVLGSVINDANGSDLIGTLTPIKISGITKANAGTTIDGVAVTLLDNTGKTVASTTSDQMGNYNFTNFPAGGNYTLRASKQGYTFTDLALGTVINDATGKDLIGTPVVVANTSTTVSGSTVNSAGAPISGVTVILAEDNGKVAQTIVSDVAGNFVFSNVTMGVSYVLKANKANYTFSDITLGVVNTPLTDKRLIATEDKFSVYPNPAQTVINIVSTSKVTGKAIIYDVVGKKVIEYNKVENNQLNCSTLLEGLYILEVETETGKKKQLITIKK